MISLHERGAFAWRRFPPVLLTLLALLGCGDGSSGPVLDLEDVAGTYELTELAFDPQGVLPEANILGSLGSSPQFLVRTNGAAQILYEDPATSLFTTIGATVRSTEDGIVVGFDRNSSYAGLLLSRRMEFTFSSTAGSLSFNDESPDGVDRQRLIELVPEWEGEQLLDPVPGRLRVTFQRE